MTRVLSIQEVNMGHKTYCTLLREFMAARSDFGFRAVWYNERRRLPFQLLRRIASQRLPVLRRRNLDLGRARSEWALAWMTRDLLVRELRASRYDVLHFHTQVQAMQSADIMRRVPSILTIDVTAYQISREAGAGPHWTHLPSIAMERKAFRAAAHIFTMSEWTRRSVIDDHGIAPGRVSTLYPGVVPLAANRAREANAVPKILFVGNDFGRKGGYDLLRAFTSLAQRAELHMMTNDPAEVSGPSVFVHRGVSAYSPAWHDLLWHADIVVLPSYKEAFGLSLVEGMAHGAALIGSRLGAIPEIVAEEENGMLVEPGSPAQLAAAMARLVDDPPLLRRMQQASTRIALEKFDARQNFERFAEVAKALGAAAPAPQDVAAAAPSPA